ncbi:MAG: response regulator [Actinobacteria bacterium]|nr:response regulator [Actinomycetota bacterium]
MARVLVIEDDPGVRRMLELMLAAEGYEPESASDGREALARLDRLPPDLVILDVMMPGVDGFTVLRELRTRDGWETVPVVVTTALGTDQDMWQGWQSGADYYLVKPFSIEELRAIVVRLLTGAPVNGEDP